MFQRAVKPRMGIPFHCGCVDELDFLLSDCLYSNRRCIRRIYWREGSRAVVCHPVLDDALRIFRCNDGWVLSRMVKKKTAMEICNDHIKQIADAREGRLATAQEYLATHPALVEELRAWRELFPGMRLIRVGPK